MEKEVRRAIKAVGRQAARRLRASGMTAAADWTPPDPATLVTRQNFVDRVIAAMAVLRVKVVRAVWGAVMEDARLNISFDVANPAIAKAVAQTNRTALADDVWAELRGSLQASHDAGLSIPDAVDALVEDVGAFGDTRATRIARTEMVSASNGASLAAVDAGGLADTKVWLATNDSRTRETHGEADGQEVPMDEAFQVGADSCSILATPTAVPKRYVTAAAP